MRPSSQQDDLALKRQCIELELKVKQLEEQLACLNFFDDGPNPSKVEALRKHNGKLLRTLAKRIGRSMVGANDLTFLADRIEKGREQI